MDYACVVTMVEALSYGVREFRPHSKGKRTDGCSAGEGMTQSSLDRASVDSIFTNTKSGNRMRLNLLSIALRSRAVESVYKSNVRFASVCLRFVTTRGWCAVCRGCRVCGNSVVAVAKPTPILYTFLPRDRSI